MFLRPDKCNRKRHIKGIFSRLVLFITRLIAVSTDCTVADQTFSMLAA